MHRRGRTGRLSIVRRRWPLFLVASLSWALAPLPANAAPPGEVLIGRYFEGSRQADILSGAPGGELTRLTKTPEFESSATFSPDGSEIAFVSQERKRDQVVSSALMVMDRDGSNIERLAEGAGGDVEWSPDGTMIAYVRGCCFTDPAELVVVDRAGGEPRVLVSTYYLGSIDWSPTGEQIVYDSIPAIAGNHDLYAVEVATAETTRLTEAEESDSAASFSPDGTRIVFQSSRDDPSTSGEGPYSSEIYVMNADGSEQTALTHTPFTWDEYPTWSPNGAWIAYHRRFDDDVKTGPRADTDVFMIRPDGTDRRLVLKNRNLDETFPMWSPDSRWIGFSRLVEGRGDAFVIRRDGSRLTRVTRHKADDFLVDWR